jgi:hypothetical protein
MDDGGFNLGDPAGRVARASRNPSVIYLGAGLVALAILLWAGLQMAARSGEQIGETNEQVVQTVNRAQQVQAQLSLETTVRAAATIQAESGSLAGATPDALATFEPSATYTAGPSTGPNVISVAISGETWAAAALADDGTCQWVRLDETGVVSYGGGTPCTGHAALGATGAGW